MSPDPRKIEGHNKLQQALHNAATDPDARAELLKNPRQVLKDAGLEISDDVALVVHENTRNQVHLVVPSQVIDWDELKIDEVDVALILECGF